TQTVTFDSTNFANPVAITITAVDDGIDGDAENTMISTITHTITSTDPAYQGVVAPSVDVKVVSDDVAGVLLTPTDGSTPVDANSADSYSVRLTKQPLGAGVQVHVQLHTDGQELISSADSRLQVTTTFSTRAFDASSASAVNLAADTIAFASPHGFVT